MNEYEKQRMDRPVSNADAIESSSGNSIMPPPLQLSADPSKDRDSDDRIERERPEQERPERAPEGPEDTYGKPYATWAEAFAAESFLKSVLIPAETALFGSEVGGLYLSYLNREPGDSLDRASFGPGTDLSSKFTDCEVMEDETRRLMRKMSGMVGNLDLPANEWVDLTIEDAFGTEKEERDVNYSNPYDAPGNIAGGYAKNASDAGDDVRYASGKVQLYRVTDSAGKTTKIIMRNQLTYECLDCIDFIPGNPGTGDERRFTVPLPRLEATGWAYDKPFQVVYRAPSKTMEFSPSDIGKKYPDDDEDRNIRPEPRKEKERDYTPRD